MLFPGCILLCILLREAESAVDHVTLQCPLSLAGALHPVQAQLERFGAGPGCAAKEGGAKETHVISVEKASHSPDKQVTVVLRPLSYSRPVARPVMLLLSSQHGVSWVLESEGLPENLHVMIQVSVNSEVELGRVSARVHSVPMMPWQPRALLHWTLQRHSTISSLIHSAHANRIYLRLGEDPSMPSVCHLQPLFLSQNYLASELQEQQLSGCTPTIRDADPEVHVIKLWSAGSGLCGSLQVEVPISLLPPVVDVGWYNIVLVLSSAAPVNWALVTPGLRGHITVHSSHSVTPLYPPKPDLSMTSTVVPDLLTFPDLLVWANQSGYPIVTSYTEANLANRFAIKLRRGGTAQAMEAKTEEERLRQWLSREDDEDDEGSREAVRAQCVDGRLTVSVDKHILQALSLSVSTVTLRDPSCQAQSNGSHFLLAFPVISCGTEGEMERQSKGVHYKNMVLLWKHKPLFSVHNETNWKKTEESTPLVIHFSCMTLLPSPPTKAELNTSPRPEGALLRGRALDLPWLARPGSAPTLSMQLFPSEKFERRAMGPCVVAAGTRVYAEISGSSSLSGRVEVSACMVSPLSDPRAHAGWPLIHNSCPADPSFTLEPSHREGWPQETRGEEDDSEEDEGGRKARDARGQHEPGRQGGASRQEKARNGEKENSGRPRSPAPGRLQADGEGTRPQGGRSEEAPGEEEARDLRFSFTLKPVFNNSIQFLHCSLLVCQKTQPEGSLGTTTPRNCTQGPSIPALIHTPATQQCEHRNLSRPVLVTYSATEGLAGLLAPPAGQLSQKYGGMETSQHSSYSTGVDTGPVLVAVFSAFLLGVSVVGVLWCIYSCTGQPPAVHRDVPIETMNLNPRSWNPVAQLEQTISSV
ncbi:transforming growth factor beta receptor type 3 [Electrophorus electricus]|uniref:transforming growth factor beta receptor type 3 n=1 Tax=Electrophorus electricus TaxID=8005 RepID=UPI0015CFDA82|nr:transforming growth factor beta receptor type 3 [Electrophorus electricus]XP_035380735.1 transforming growth factor beta receptor type 3 [Electrophorus electricus]XP_035380736.1 transforming growth factor beta receptor type 3 [Electrophorus electricus]